MPGIPSRRERAPLLDAHVLRAGAAATADNMRACYEALIREAVLETQHMGHLDACLADMEIVRVQSNPDGRRHQ